MTEEEQIAELNNLARIARGNVHNRVQRMRLDGAKPGRKQSAGVSQEEYTQALARSLKRDSKIVGSVKHENVSQSFQEWQHKVGATFADATTDFPPVLERVHRFGTPEGRHKSSLVMHGNIGVGKTWQAYAYINEAMRRGLVSAGQIVAGSEMQIIDKIASAGYKRNEMFDELRAERNKIYFIDDVGASGFGSRESRWTVWHGLLDHIYSHHLTILMTTNLQAHFDGDERQPKGLNAHIGGRAFSRLLSLCGRDGFQEMAGSSKRERVLEEREGRYRAAFAPPQKEQVDPAVKQAGKLHAPKTFRPTED